MCSNFLEFSTPVPASTPVRTCDADFLPVSHNAEPFRTGRGLPECPTLSYHQGRPWGGNGVEAVKTGTEQRYRSIYWTACAQVEGREATTRKAAATKTKRRAMVGRVVSRTAAGTGPSCLGQQSCLQTRLIRHLLPPVSLGCNRSCSSKTLF